MKAPHLGPKSVTTGGAKDLDETQLPPFAM